MKYRKLGKTGFEISEISLGTWQVGGKWGSGFDDNNADEILNTAIDQGINFIDTADVYESGLSEKAVGRIVRSRSERIYVASKCGRQVNPHVSDGYQPSVLRKYVEDSLDRLGLETLDLIQLHCPPSEVYSRPEIFQLFNDLKAEGKIQHLGVSVETVDEAMKSIEYENVASIQIIFNIFRQKPSYDFFAAAHASEVGIIARVPLASGLLTGKFSAETQFASEDHRHFNRNGEAFDRGETFSGVNFEKGLMAVEELRNLFPDRDNLAPLALDWILNFPEISTVIPGASRPDQLVSNLDLYKMDHRLTDSEIESINAIYQRLIKEDVEPYW